MNLNGTVKFRNRRLNIFWTGEFAQHLAERHKTDPKRHPFLHVQAQKLLQTCTEFQKSGKSFIGTIELRNRKVSIVFFIKSNFAIIKSCYIRYA